MRKKERKKGKIPAFPFFYFEKFYKKRGENLKNLLKSSPISVII